MKQTFKTALCTLLALLALQTASAKNVVAPKAYMFGFAASFSDSTVYFTEIQEIDSVWFTQKKKMLAGRSNYSYQLRDFFALKRDQPKRTCIVICNEKRKKVEKKYAKLQKLYTTQKGKDADGYAVFYVPTSEFKFESVNMADNDTEQAPKKEKKARKDMKPGKPGKPGKDGPRGQRPPRSL